MSVVVDATGLWRGLTVGFALPDRAFGAAVDVDGLLGDPELHYQASPETNRLLLMPRAGTFARLTLEWETLPEIGVFAAPPLPAALAASPFDEAETSRLETWMRDVAGVLHANRDRIRATAERAVSDAAAGLDESLPREAPPRAHVVSSRVGTRVAGPDPGSRFGVVDVVRAPISAGAPALDEALFVDRETGRPLGSRVTLRAADGIAGAAYEATATGVTTRDLQGWYDQHIAREVLFDDVWQALTHLVAGLETPASVQYFDI
ncbi:hypothetical protein AS850_11335 [Frondihabitans sp. 762G35]|uniref:hypothetical protein n=1 Tax=Frondihabitans sp. 762G35 TaxID=1446794 RepID=UPI000D2135FA|nr:hypothetical protein [Frondihabitans sp. 762G35]ARC57664.1 hypothetical protein AS850_11335 [Frondihabitans sp. 762G35]